MATVQKQLRENPHLFKNEAQSLLNQIRKSPSAPLMIRYLRNVAPELGIIPQTTYTLFREFEQSGERNSYQRPYYVKRSMLTRAVAELICGEDADQKARMREAIHDLLWDICEETTWLLPAHEEQGPDFWDLKPSPRNWAWGTNTILTREPDSIDLFAAETGASLAETLYLIGDQLEAEVVQRVRQEVDRHIFKPYLAYGRHHWWHKGALNWNGVCNGAIGLAFLRLEQDPIRLGEALDMVLEGFEAYLATGFEADGGSIEGPGYWNYGLMYFVTLAEELRIGSEEKLDLLASPRLVDIARYPLGMALSPGTYINFGDATEHIALQPGVVQRLAERTGVEELRGLLLQPENLEGRGASAAKLAIILRDFAWWDGKSYPFPSSAHTDYFLPECAIAKFTGRSPEGKPVILAAKAGHNDGHHSHTDVGQFVLNVGGESLLCDPGRGLYSRDYFRKPRYENIFCNSIGHSVPRIGGQLQMPGPEFGGRRQYHGTIVEHRADGVEKFIIIEMQNAYAVPGLTLACRQLTFQSTSGRVRLSDDYSFSGQPQEIEEGFVTWAQVNTDGSLALITGKMAALQLNIREPDGAVFSSVSFVEECEKNQREGTLTRLVVQLPVGVLRFVMDIIPVAIQHKLGA